MDDQDRSDAIQLFVSFAPPDIRWKDDFEKHLDVLRRTGQVSTRNTPAGEAVEQWLDRVLSSTDVAVLLVTADWLASAAIQEVEFPRLLKRRDNKTLLIVPIIVSSCAWELHPHLKSLHPLPRGSKAVASYEGDQREHVFTDIVKEISTMSPTQPYRPHGRVEVQVLALRLKHEHAESRPHQADGPLRWTPGANRSPYFLKRWHSTSTHR